MKPKDYIKEAFHKGKIHHSILVEGDGEEAARYLAQILNCNSEDPPCGICRSCKAVEAGLHPDFITVIPSKSIKIEQIRRIIELSSLEPVVGKLRVIFVREADKMTPEAANAFLKVLEEPPPSTYFLLATFNPASLPITVLSRCLHLKEEGLEEEKVHIGQEIFLGREKLQAYLEVIKNREALKELVSSTIDYLQSWLHRKAKGEDLTSWQEEKVLEALEALWGLKFYLEQPVNLSIAKDYFRVCVEKLGSF